MAVRSKLTVSRGPSAGTGQRVAWPGKRSAAQGAGKNPAVAPGKRSRTQGVPTPMRRKPPTP